METNADKVITFRFATLKKIMQVVDIEQKIDDKIFNDWFKYKYKINEQEDFFIKEIIRKNITFLTSYNEISLIIKFIGPILNKVEFVSKTFRDWYGYKIEVKLNGYTLKGEPDLTVATGIDEPETPYFFLQEYKKAVNPTGNPEYQVLAAMLATLTLNNSKMIRGAYVIGRYWNFMILKKMETGNYEYFVSDGLDSLKLSDLKQIYINLQAVKYLYCE